MTREEIDKLPRRHRLRRFGAYVTDGAWLVLGKYPEAEDFPGGAETVRSWAPGDPVEIIPNTAGNPWIECRACCGEGNTTCLTCGHDTVCDRCNGKGGSGDRVIQAMVRAGAGEWAINQALVHILDGLDLYVVAECTGAADYPIIGGYRDGKLIAAVATMRE